MQKKDNFYCLENILFNTENQDFNFTLNIEGEQHVFTEGVVFTRNTL